MPKSEESRAGEGQREERMETVRGRGSRSYRMVYHATPMRADVGRRGVERESESARTERAAG